MKTLILLVKSLLEIKEEEVIVIGRGKETSPLVFSASFSQPVTGAAYFHNQSESLRVSLSLVFSLPNEIGKLASDLCQKGRQCP